jgi:hypothetical protein
MGGTRQGQGERLYRWSSWQRRRRILHRPRCRQSTNLTFWETEEAAAETDKFADQSRASTVEATGVELEQRGTYTVVMRF